MVRMKCSVIACIVMLLVACEQHTVTESTYFNHVELVDIIEEPIEIIDEPVELIIYHEMEETEEKIEEAFTMTEQEVVPSKKIAITFDDGPHEEMTPLILDLLSKHDAKATFFMLGQQAERYPDIVKRAFDEGHEIGNHTWDHPDLTKIDNEAIMHQFNTTSEIIASITGEAPLLIRPPYGNYNDNVQQIAPGPLINWSIDAIDWRDRDADQIMINIEQTFHEDGILLMHDVFASTVEAVERVLSTYSEEGYEFVTVSELLQFDRSEPVNGKVYQKL